MIANVELHPEAISELEESYQWYEKRLEGLGIRFIASVNKRLNEIAEHPERYAKKKRNYREVMIEGFPYMVIYEMFQKEQIVFVSYIFHTKKNPASKYKR